MSINFSFTSNSNPITAKLGTGWRGPQHLCDIVPKQHNLYRYWNSG